MEWRVNATTDDRQSSARRVPNTPHAMQTGRRVVIHKRTEEGTVDILRGKIKKSTTCGERHGRNIRANVVIFTISFIIIGTKGR